LKSKIYGRVVRLSDRFLYVWILLAVTILQLLEKLSYLDNSVNEI